MACCQGSVMLLKGTLGRPLLETWLAVSLSAVCVLIVRILLLFGPRLIIGMLMILLWKCLIIPISGRMVVGRTSLRVMGLRWLVLGFMCLLLSLLFKVRFGVRRRSTVMLAGIVAVLFCPHQKLFSVLNSGVPSLLCSLFGLVIGVLITSVLPGLLDDSWTGTAWSNLCLWLRMGIWSLLSST